LDQFEPKISNCYLKIILFQVFPFSDPNWGVMRSTRRSLIYANEFDSFQIKIIGTSRFFALTSNFLFEVSYYFLKLTLASNYFHPCKPPNSGIDISGMPTSISLVLIMISTFLFHKWIPITILFNIYTAITEIFDIKIKKFNF